MKEQFNPNIENVNYKTFNEYFPDGQITEISLDEIPEKVMEYFESESKMFVLPENYRPRNFDKAYLIDHKDGSKTYAVEQVKTYGANSKTEQLAFFSDNNNGEITGHSELRYNTDCEKEDEEYFKNKPFVGITHTEEHARRTGLGTRRIFIMNAFSQMKYGLPLYSSTTIADEAKSLWEMLVQHGKAKKFTEKGNDRFVLLDNKKPETPLDN